MNYSLDTPVNRKLYVPDIDTPFAPAYTPSNPSELDQTHRKMTWQHDSRQKVIGTQPKPESARADKKK
jgi:hypothetical protein